MICSDGRATRGRPGWRRSRAPIRRTEPHSTLTISAFDPTSGRFMGLLEDTEGNPIWIDGLWALAFGNGGSGGAKNVLYFTAGIQNQKHGLFGSIAVAS